MLELFTRHGGFDLKLKCVGDLDVDQHHTVEDVGIALGEAFGIALGDKKGFPDRVGGGLLRWLCAGREGECACEDDVWAEQSP
jgi:imidazoleglycerol phosphate dehydratase HisB